MNFTEHLKSRIAEQIAKRTEKDVPKDFDAKFAYRMAEGILSLDREVLDVAIRGILIQVANAANFGKLCISVERDKFQICDDLMEFVRRDLASNRGFRLNESEDKKSFVLSW